MLFLALILVLAALALLVIAFLIGPSWAWGSIALSVLAAFVLAVDAWRQRRSRKAQKVGEADEAEEVEEAVAEEAEAAEGEEAEAAEPVEAVAQTPSSDESETEEPAEVGEAAEPAEPEEAAEPAAVGAVAAADDQGDDGESDSEPGEEPTDAADLLIVCELDDQVMVIDEHPRYHLPECGWLIDKDTIPIAVAEARELGFTPCARCGPDGILAAEVRRKKRKTSSSWAGRG